MKIVGPESEKRSSATVSYPFLLLLSAALAAVLGGCTIGSAPAGQRTLELPVEEIWADSQCGYAGGRPMVTWMADQNQFKALASGVPSGDLKAMAAPGRVDWDRVGLVWIAMGIKPSGGYALELAGKKATVSHGVAVITVRWRQPGPGSVVTQQLTSPCLMLKLPKGNFSAIEIKDETGQVRARGEL